ncbi:MAG: GAF domain-containing sensor histidine kinase [Chloroflexi bacterium]|nr:GAF domain-containing sensor histidine kinase [Chloroflexota bacterium]
MLPTTPARYLKLERMLEISRLLNQALDLEPFLQTLAEYSCELTLSSAGSIFLFEEETGLLKFVAAPRSQLESLKRVRVPLENSIAGQAYTQCRPVIVQNAAQEANVFRDVDHILDFDTRSILAVPILYGGHALGAMEAVNKLGDSNYTEEDTIILETLASYAATALFSAALLEETRLAQQNLNDLERMKSDFIAIASHELRTPVGLVLGHASFLRESAKEEQQIRQLDVIVRSAARLKEIVEEMSNLELNQAGKARVRRSQVSVSSLVQEVCKGFLETARRKSITINVEIPESSLVVEADEEKIAIALGNLVENALAFTDEKGFVFVRAERLPGFVKVSVIDNGVGIPARDLHRVFDRFYQVESHFTRRHGGLGLGLSVAKVMIEMHGGQIWAESIEGKGSNFSFLLPSRTGKAARAVSAFEI